jgi:hypothetical protein
MPTRRSPDILVVKQVRPLPAAPDGPPVTPFLINEPAEYCVLQGEYGDVLANHRLKSRWQFATRNLWLTEQNLQSTFFADVTLEYAEACQLYEQSGPLDGWPRFAHDFAGGTAVESWRFDKLQNPRSYELTVDNVPTSVSRSQCPLLVLRDFYDIALRVDYEGQVPGESPRGSAATTTQFARLCPCPVGGVGDQLQQRVLDNGSGVTATTRFYWPPAPEDPSAGYTAPLVAFVETEISGLTSSPVVLQDEYSQTYRPGHHNFTEDFVFDPALDPAVPQAQLDELEAAGVRAIRASTDGLFMLFDEAGWGDPCLDCSGFDADHDGGCTGEPTFDCDDANPDVWATPGEVPALEFADHVTLDWTGPVEPGGTSVVFDVLRSEDSADFLAGGSCVESDDGQDLSATDTEEPAAGAIFFYLARASNACPQGEGPLGTDSSGVERPGRACP